jgi:hypothetical protein
MSNIGLLLISDPLILAWQVLWERNFEFLYLLVMCPDSFAFLPFEVSPYYALLRFLYLCARFLYCTFSYPSIWGEHSFRIFVPCGQFTLLSSTPDCVQYCVFRTPWTYFRVINAKLRIHGQATIKHTFDIWHMVKVWIVLIFIIFEKETSVFIVFMWLWQLEH